MVEVEYVVETSFGEMKTNIRDLTSEGFELRGDTFTLTEEGEVFICQQLVKYS